MKMFLLFSHQLTDEQVREAHDRLGVQELVYLPPELQQLWSNVDPDGDWDHTFLEEIQSWIAGRATLEDIALVQGEYGATFKMVCWFIRRGMRVFYATSRRVVEERLNERGVVETKRIFQHVQFREYSKDCLDK